ncbi:MAG TPA: 3-hydroxyacyl-CoA dehydrogenase [Gemmatimonas aurantiaca]|uniref:3-hydroxyacyl-CoA dehydrogenase/enoyl-CoA hydratase n=2 Tax=Gemmatimonas aurantiaca TaxID=173480 RepID=C1AAJ9_GEMAT|nr:3-hydroxyacyl-CoA dehydrogenase/enoyl-CoA hydratase family protein [Gemmatimonas aurantiaca]BAH39797.1 3-hydroxyacyl-CoA dehydrogenase/enoyl-CoA hydratase [Gemmatimonas aurantiaca T-27]HCT58193.1 3-hydroxyacyl-CoA dehydrogenase [Gemmatimonas aurantiaca]
MRVTTVGVVGAGAMGSGIAALAASAGCRVVLLDIPGDTDPTSPNRSAPARNGLQKAIKSKPASFMETAAAARVRTGNTEDHLAWLAECDWICEAIIEQPAPKQQLFTRIEALMKPTAIVSSNTSGIPMAVLLEGRSEKFRRRFLGTHFFNPPRYMHLLEIIPTPETDPAVIGAMREFAERTLGKGIVIAKDVPGFIANRLGVYGMVATMRRMQEHGLTIDEVDGLTGSLIGRARTATFRTGDLSGLDVLAHVTKGIGAATGEDFALPGWMLTDLVATGKLGDKTGGGFYQKTKTGTLTYDWKTSQYVPQQRLEGGDIGQAIRLPIAQRLPAAKAVPGAQGAFLRDHLVDAAHYTLTLASQLGYDLVAIDRAMEWGYGWEAGPFQVMDALGLDWLREEFRAHGLDIPALLDLAQGSFYKNGEYLTFEGTYEPVPAIPGRISLAGLAQSGRVLEDNGLSRLIDLGDGVACFEFRSKMNSLGAGVLEGLEKSLRKIEKLGFNGLVIGNEDARAFSVGADLSLVSFAISAGAWDDIAVSCKAFQDAVMSIRRAPFPVVVAPAGMTLGGGAEFTLHADAVQAHAETYMGLVEAGVGLIPGGGGTKELLVRFTGELQQYEEVDLFAAVKRAFKLIAFATTSTSAPEAKALGFLSSRDRISMNRDHQIADAKRRVLDLAPGYLPPIERTVRALGREGLGNLEYALWAAKEAGQASAHDVRVGRAAAYVLCGGDGAARDVTEQDLLDLEREQFMSLLGTKETQERIAYTLKTGKPLRN